MQDSPMKWLPDHPTLRPTTNKHGPSNQLFSNLLQTMNVQPGNNRYLSRAFNKKDRNQPIKNKSMGENSANEKMVTSKIR